MKPASLDRACRDPARVVLTRRFSARLLLVGTLLATMPFVHGAEPPNASSTQPIREAPAPFNRVRHGMTTAEVMFAVGAPTERFAGEVWVYWNCVQNGTGARQPAYDTMVLRFANDRLADVKLIEGKVFRALLDAQAKARAARAVARR